MLLYCMLLHSCILKFNINPGKKHLCDSEVGKMWYLHTSNLHNRGNLFQSLNNTVQIELAYSQGSNHNKTNTAKQE